MSIDNSAEKSFMTWKYQGRKDDQGLSYESTVPDNEIRSMTANPTRIVAQTIAQEIRAEMSLANKKRLEAFGSSRGSLPQNDVYVGVSVVTLTARATRKALVAA